MIDCFKCTDSSSAICIESDVDTSKENVKSEIEAGGVELEGHPVSFDVFQIFGGRCCLG